MIELYIPFAVAGLAILWVFGIKPELDKRKGNTRTIERFYRSKDEKETKKKPVWR